METKQYPEGGLKGNCVPQRSHSLETSDSLKTCDSGETFIIKIQGAGSTVRRQETGSLC